LERLNTPAAYELRMRLAQAALTLLTNRDAVLPLNAEAKGIQQVRHIAIGQGDDFKNQLHELAGIESITIGADYTQAQINAATRNFRNGETIIVSYHHIPGRRYSFANFPVSETVVNFTQNLAKNHNVILVFFGNPYAIANFSQPEVFSGFIVAYDNSAEAQVSSARAIFGQIPFLGRLPITINELFAENDGIILRAMHPDRGLEIP